MLKMTRARASSPTLMPPGPALPHCTGKGQGQLAQTRGIHMAFGSNLGHRHNPDPFCCRAMDQALGGCRTSPCPQVSVLVTHFRLFLTTLTFPLLPLFIVFNILLLFLYLLSTTYLFILVVLAHLLEWLPTEDRGWKLSGFSHS